MAGNLPLPVSCAPPRQSLNRRTAYQGLPPIEDDGLHDGDAHLRPVAYWHFHVSTDVERGDRLLCRERAWTMLDRCGANHPRVRDLHTYMTEQYDAEWASEWMAERQVWAVRPL